MATLRDKRDMFDRDTAMKVFKRVEDLLRKTIKDEFGLDAIVSSASFGATINFGVKVERPMDPDRKVTDEEVKRGLAPRGTPIICSTDGKRYEIVTAKKTNYVARNGEGKQYAIPFRHSSLAPEQNQVPQAEAGKARP